MVTSKSVTVIHLDGIAASRDCWYRFLRPTLPFSQENNYDKNSKIKASKDRMETFPMVRHGQQYSFFSCV